MAPVLTGMWWGPEAGMVGSGAAAAGELGSWLGGGQVALVGILGGLTTLVLLSLLLLLCAGCQGQKKVANGNPGVDHENLVNGESEREVISQSVDSPGTDLAISSSHNGPLTSGTVLSDTRDSSPQPSEDLISSQSEVRSSKCPQGRELPRIPPNSALIVEGPPAPGENTYEMLKEIVVASRDVSTEDSLYETVKELKDPTAQHSLHNGTSRYSPTEPPKSPKPPALPNDHPSPCAPERLPLCDGVEYASIDLNKKSRYSADMEAKRRSDNATVGPCRPAEEPEDDPPPPLPEKVLDENDNQSVVVNGLAGGELHNGELHSPGSSSPRLANHIMSDNEPALYSTVNKPSCGGAVHCEEKEPAYSSIAEINGIVPSSSSSDLYATVRDIYPQAEVPQPPAARDPASDSLDPGYETIRIPKAGGADGGARAAGATELACGAKPEPDYASVGELGLSGEISRL